MSNLIQSVETFFASASAWGAGLPHFVSVPLIMILAAVGTAAIVGLLLWLIRLIFGKKAIDFIKNIPEHLNAGAAHGTKRE
jgi:hypothetical protein